MEIENNESLFPLGEAKRTNVVWEKKWHLSYHQYDAHKDKNREEAGTGIQWCYVSFLSIVTHDSLILECSIQY